MTPETLREAIREAKRFLEKAEAVTVFHGEHPDKTPYDRIAYSSPEKAACKRASMDLTRALARMRASR